MKEPKRGRLKIRESVVEAYLCKQAKKLGLLPYKFSSPGRASVPDRILLAPFGYLAFVEVKAPGGVCTTAQLREHEKIRNLGQKVYVCDSFEKADEIVHKVRDGV